MPQLPVSIRKIENSWQIVVTEGGHGAITITDEAKLFELHDQLSALFKLFKEMDYRPPSRKKTDHSRHRSKPTQKLRQSWAGALQEHRSDYTAVELQHQASAWRSGL